MTIHKNRGKISFECDSCDEVLDTGETNFDQARASLREENWKVKKEIDGEWYHLCPECR